MGAAFTALVDTHAFRQVLRQVPTAVSVVAGTTAAGAAGLVVGSFVSVSLRPPLVAVFIGETSTSWPAIQDTGTFAVNVLGHHQHALCDRFAHHGGDKFAGVRYDRSPLGNPWIVGASAWLDCMVDRVQVIGDHLLVVGAVTDAVEGPATAPMVFHGGALHTVTGAGTHRTHGEEKP